MRERTCYCIDCICGEEDQCSNKEWMDEWKDVKLENLIDMTYKLHVNKNALVLSGTIRRVCGDLKRKRKNIFQVPLNVNEEIIASL